MKKRILQTHPLFMCLGLATTAVAKIDLVTMPARDNVQLTIYNDENLTMVREQRTLTLSKGRNELEFGWANTLVDPTSVELIAPEHQDKVRLIEVKYPPNVTGTAIWVVDSDIDGPVPVNIRFFTANIHWNATYRATLDEKEERMDLTGYIRVDNQSGEDYLNAQTRVVVGNLNLLDSIPDLATRPHPYGRPHDATQMLYAPAPMAKSKQIRMERAVASFDMIEEKAIQKTALSEFFIYSIEGTEDLHNGWGKRLKSLSQTNIPVQSLFRYDESRYGNATHRLVRFANNKQHKLGDEPLPDGRVTVYRDNADGPLSIVGQTQVKYIPKGEDVELDFGRADAVTVEPTLMSTRTENHQYDQHGNISGYDRLEEWQIEVNNYQLQRAEVQIERSFFSSYWKLTNNTDKLVKFEQLDHDTVRYEISMPRQGKKVFSYVVKFGEGTRQSAFAQKEGE